VHAQFGVAGNRRAAGTNFQDLQELAQQKTARETNTGGAAAAPAGGGVPDMAAMQEMFQGGGMEEMLKGFMDNPEYLEQLGAMGDMFGDALQQMMKLPPDELAAQMEQAMKLMMNGDMVENLVGNREQIIKTLESTKAVPEEELERFKTDPEYFEQKMRESFSEMGKIMDDPEYITKAAEAISGISKLMDDPDSLNEMISAMKSGLADMQDDDKIEEARLKFLSGDFGDLPAFKGAFDTPEMQAILKDPAKWKEVVKEGQEILSGSLLDGAKEGSLGGAKDEL
jgi:hypothetical protein